MKSGIFIGLNYKKSDYELSCCENDMIAIEQRARMCKVNTQIFTDEDNVGISELIDLFAEHRKGKKIFDTFYFFYSGHGTQFGGDEEDGYEEAFCLFKNGYIDLFTDNRLREELLKFPCQVVVIADSCFSGDMDRSTNPNKRKYLPYDLIKDQVRQISPKATLPSTNVYKAKINWMFASSGNEYSYEADEYGFFTGSLIKHWDNGTKYITQLMKKITLDIQHMQHPVHKYHNTTGLKKLF